MVKCLPSMWETWVQSLGWDDPLEKAMATHSSIPTWKIPWTEEPGKLQSMGSQSDTTALLHFLSFIWKHNARKGVMYIHTYKFYIYTYYLYKYIHVFMCLCVLVTQSCLTFCDPMDCSPLGSSVHTILQAWILGGLPFLSPGTCVYTST